MLMLFWKRKTKKNLAQIRDIEDGDAAGKIQMSICASDDGGCLDGRRLVEEKAVVDAIGAILVDGGRWTSMVSVAV